MSNVLIGIIGVILFIGLALAGAMILGDDFSSSSNASQAAAVISQLQQTQSAVEMYRLKTGIGTVRNGSTAFLMPRFLKTQPFNSSRAGRANPGRYEHSVHLNNDTCQDYNDEGGIPVATHVMTVVGSAATSSKDEAAVCQAIADIHNGGTIQTHNYPNVPTNSVGCVKMTAAPCGATTGDAYVAYARL